jgi:hypothetical protein
VVVPVPLYGRCIHGRRGAYACALAAVLSWSREGIGAELTMRAVGRGGFALHVCKLWDGSV